MVSSLIIAPTVELKEYPVHKLRFYRISGVLYAVQRRRELHTVGEVSNQILVVHEIRPMF